MNKTILASLFIGCLTASVANAKPVSCTNGSLGLIVTSSGSPAFLLREMMEPISSSRPRAISAAQEVATLWGEPRCRYRAAIVEGIDEDQANLAFFDVTVNAVDGRCIENRLLSRDIPRENERHVVCR